MKKVPATGLYVSDEAFGATPNIVGIGITAYGSGPYQFPRPVHHPRQRCQCRETPPPGVPPIEPDTRGATTIREQLAKHRSVAACADCHAKIDPWGGCVGILRPGWRLEDALSGFQG